MCDDGSVERVERTLILDFDGTVAIGDDPALAYARRVAALHGARHDLEVRVARHLSGAHVAGLEDADDGYLAVAFEARAAALDPSAVGGAFLSVREGLADGSIGLDTPTGLVAELREVRDRGVRVVLVTNAPAAGLDRILDRLGLSAVFDDVIADAGKPEGLARVLDGLGHPVDSSRVLSIGDIWVNDCAVPAQRGAATALIDPHQRGRGRPDVRVRRFAELYAPLRIWAASGAWPTRDDAAGNEQVTSV